MPNESDVLDDFVLEDEDVDEVDETEEVDDPDEGESGDVDDDEDGEEPEDLASAFAALQRSRQKDADGDLGGSGDGGDQGDDDAADDDDEEDEALEDDRQDPDGGPGDAYARADLQAVAQRIDQEVAQTALRQAAEEFSKDNIHPLTMNHLYRQDKQSGRVTYVNPDDPSRPFASRIEAQQWLDSFNGQLRQELQKRAREINRDLQRQVAPAKRLIAFAPTYQSMASDVQSVFDDLVEDYAITNANGEVIGYSCDLNKIAAKAQRLAAKYSPNKEKAPAATRKSGPQRRPATDMRTHGSSASGSKDPNREPATLEEAFQIMREQRRAGKK